MEKATDKAPSKMEPLFDIEYAELYQPVKALGTVKQSINKSWASITYDVKAQLLFVATKDGDNLIVPFTNICYMKYK